MGENGDRTGSGPRHSETADRRGPPWDETRKVHEHYHRYAVTARFVRGRRVLDLAAGAGFGAALLAEQAAEVVGVVSDAATARHAAETHGGPNLSFSVGSPTDPEMLGGAAPFDVVVWFETAERVADHTAVLRLARSRMVAGGLLIAGAPDAAVEHGRDGREYAFRAGELAAAQFETLLEDSFRHVAVLKQNIAVGSLLTPAAPGDPDTAVEGVRLQHINRHGSERWSIDQGVPHTYLLGLASDGRLPRLPAVAVLLDADSRESGEQPREPEPHHSGRDEVARLEADLADLRSRRAEAESRARAAEREQQRLRAELDRLAADLHTVRLDDRRGAARIEWLRDTVAELEAHLADAEQRAAGHAGQEEQRTEPSERTGGGYRRVLARLFSGGGTAASQQEESAGVVRPDTGPVAVPHGEDPRVSVVVPVHGGWPHTRRCLRALAEHRVSVPFEVIVVDDASPDDSAEHLARCPGVRLVRSERNLGFLGACNLGAEVAAGEYLFFLAGDAEVTRAWLDVLTDTADSDERIGLVGCKLIGTDGLLRECGAVVWSDGTTHSLGASADPRAAEHNVLREVDYCSGTALLVRAELFGSLGGFDTGYSPVYYEDVDLAFAVRAAGYRTVVQPAATVLEHRALPGLPTGGGVGRYRELNRRLFTEKWAETLAAEHLSEASERNLWSARARGPRGHHGPLVLVKDSQVPRPDHDSGSVRMRRLLEQLTGLGARVVFFPDNHAALQPYTGDLQRIGITVLHGVESQRAFLEQAGPRITLAMLSRPQVAWSLLEELRTCAPRCVIAYDTVAVHFPSLRRQAALAEEEGESTTAAALRRKAFASRQMEIGLVRSCDITLVVSESERALLRDLVEDADIRVLSNVHEVEWRTRQPGSGRDVLFVGGFDHPPNTDAAVWAAGTIMPMVRRHCPDAVLHLLGSNPGEEVLRLHGRGVEVHGWVADLGPMYARARATIAPLRFGAGVRGKVGESLGAGVPVVGTGLAMEGMRLTPGEDVLVADDARDLAEALVRLLTEDAEWSRLAEAGRRAVAARFGPEVSRTVLGELLDAGQ